ncbi:MAG: hypothetical protein Q9160_005192 [Pyrenula sp. 1 TL-2023]
MSQYLAPTGPPPPKVPEGWKAVYNDQYKEWYLTPPSSPSSPSLSPLLYLLNLTHSIRRFYVNLHTKASQWDLPTTPAPDADSSAPPPGPPPSYSTGPDAPRTTGDSKNAHLESNNPYNQHNIASGPSGNTESDAALAARLQAEEDSRARGSAAGGHSPNPGAASSYYGDQQGPGPQGPLYDQSQDRGSGGKKSGGFLGKLLSKASSKTGGGGGGMGGFGHSQQHQQQHGGYGQQQGYGGYPPQQQQYYPQQGGYPPQGGYGHGPGGYGGYPPQHQQQFMGGGGRKPGKGGMGAGGAAALGLGGGLLGGALLADAIDDHDDREYDQGYQDGQNDDFGGGGDDFGGGDF